jgi:plastocyanin
MKRFLLITTISILAIGILSGCSLGKSAQPTDMATMSAGTTSNTYGSGTTAPTKSGAPVIAPPAVSGEGVQAEISDFAFVPGTLTVKVGTTVTWTNKDSVGHTVTSDDGIFDSGILGKGSSFSYKFTTVGTFGYFCTPHPYMVGTVVVTE